MCNSAGKTQRGRWTGFEPTHQVALGFCEQIAGRVVVGPCLARAPLPQVEGVCKQRQREAQATHLCQRLLRTQQNT